MYLGKWASNGEYWIFSSSKSFLFRNRAMEESLRRVGEIDWNRKDKMFENILEPLVWQDCAEECQAFSQSVRLLVLLQHLIVLADGRQEHHQQNIIETMNPLLTLRSLPTHVNLWKNFIKTVLYQQNTLPWWILSCLPRLQMCIQWLQLFWPWSEEYLCSQVRTLDLTLCECWRESIWDRNPC